MHYLKAVCVRGPRIKTRLYSVILSGSITACSLCRHGLHLLSLTVKACNSRDVQPMKWKPSKAHQCKPSGGNLSWLSHKATADANSIDEVPTWKAKGIQALAGTVMFVLNLVFLVLLATSTAQSGKKKHRLINPLLFPCTTLLTYQYLQAFLNTSRASGLSLMRTHSMKTLKN